MSKRRTEIEALNAVIREAVGSGLNGEAEEMYANMAVDQLIFIARASRNRNDEISSALHNVLSDLVEQGKLGKKYHYLLEPRRTKRRGQYDNYNQD